MLKGLMHFKETKRAWHFPVLASICFGIPLLAGCFSGQMQGGMLASLAGLVVLYTHSFSITGRMITLMACSFGIMASFTMGAVFSFNPFVASLVLSIYVFVLNLALFYLKMMQPPGNFFFIMVASIAICMPYQPEAIPEKIGFVGIGTMLSCFLALVYSLLTLKRSSVTEEAIILTKSKSVHINESLIFGLFVGISLLSAYLLKLENPYWVAVSCAAIMQGSSTSQVLQRSIHRVSGTLTGLGLTWLFLLLHPSLLVICIGIIVLMVLVEWFVVRNYGVAIIFITVLSIFLAELGSALQIHPNDLIIARLLDTLLGSCIGVIGGWLLHNEQIHQAAKEKLWKIGTAVSKGK